MVVLPNDIRFFYSGGTDNQNPLASLGGQISTTQIINESQENVFNNVTLVEADNGLTDYRCFYVKNVGSELWRNAVIWREQGTQSGFDSIGIGLGTSLIDGTEQIVLDRFTAPVNVNFSGPDTKESALLLGDLAPGSRKAIWIRRIVEPLARTFKNNTFKLRVELGNPAGSGGGGGTPPGNPPGLPGTGGGGGGGGTGTGCQTGYHKVNGVCIPDTVPPITGGGGENILWQSTSWSNGHDRTITGSGDRDPDDPTLSFGAGENRELIIKGASDPGFVNHTGPRTRIYVDQYGNVANNYNASLEIQKFYPNSSLDNLSLRLRSRHNEGGSESNRFGGYGMALHHDSVEAAREDFHNEHTDMTPSSTDLPHNLVDGTEYGVRFSVRDITGGKVEAKLELKGGAYGSSYVVVATAVDNNPESYMLDKQLYLNNRSYFWIRTNGDSPEDVRYGFVVLRDLDKSSVTTCPAGYTLKNGICVADTLPPPGTGGGGTQPPPSGGGGATIADYTATTVGDQTCGSTATTIMSRIIARNPSFHMPLGDNTYTSSSSCWISMMAPLKSKIKNCTIGNHDDEEDESNSLRSQYLANYNLSQPYHAFTFRNTFVLTLYTYAPFGFGNGSAQFQFAQQQLAAARSNSAIDWIIVCFHKPIYTAASNHSGYTAFRDVYHPLFDQYKVDICLSGHVHNYQRTKPLKYTGTGTGNSIANNEVTNYINLVNPIFLIVGCGGREISGISSQPSYNASQREGYGYLLLSWSNNGKRVTGRHYDQTDTLRDEWTMDKTAVSQPPPPPSGGGGTTPPPPTGGQIDSFGIKWLLATGQQSVIPQSRENAGDFRWSEVYPNLRDNGYEATLYGTFMGVGSDGHCALKHWGGNHSGDCQYSESGSCCCWYDTGIRSNGAIQLQIERPHPNNDDFNASTTMNNIGIGMNGNTIGLKWIIYPIQQGGDVDRGGVKLKMYVDTAPFVNGKPQGQWRQVYDITDTGQILGDYPAPSEQEIEVRNSDTDDTTMYGGGIHWRRLSRTDINNGGTTGGGGGGGSGGSGNLTFTYFSKFGSQGTGNGQFTRIEQVTVDPQDNIYVCDSDAERIIKFSPTGTYIMHFGSPGTGDSQFNSVYDVKIDSSGNIWVADQHNNAIKKFSSAGVFISKITNIVGASPTTLTAPEAIAFDYNDNSLYISDTDGNRIIKLDSNLNFVWEIGEFGTGDGQFNIPHGLAVGPDRNIYVGDHHSPRIQVFDRNGNFLRKWGTEGLTGGQMTAIKESLHVDNRGRVYQVNGDLRPCILVFDSFGNFITQIGTGTAGSANGQFNEPESIVINSLGQAIVSDSFNHRIQIFNSSNFGNTPAPSPGQPPTNIQYFYDSTSTQNDPQTINEGDYDTTEDIVVVPEPYNTNPVTISGGYFNIPTGADGRGRIYVDYYKKSRFTQDNLPGFNTAASLEFIQEDPNTIVLEDLNGPMDNDDLNVIFSGFHLFIHGAVAGSQGHQQEVSMNVRYYSDPSDPISLGKNGIRTSPGQFPFPGGRTLVDGNTYKVFYLLRTNREDETVVLNAWIDFGDSAGWVKVVTDYTWDRLGWFPGNVLTGYDDSNQIIQGPDLIQRHRFALRNANVAGGGETMKVKNIKIGTMPYLPDPVPPPSGGGGGGGTNPPPDDPDPPSGTSGNDANGIKMIYPTKASGDTFLWDLSGSNPRIAGQNVTSVRSTAGGPWAFSKNSTNPLRLFIYTKENSISNINVTQLSTVPPISTFNHNSLATLGYFYQARDWKNIEFTIYMSIATSIGEVAVNNQTSYVSLIARSANHTVANGGCGGSSYHVDFNFVTGGIRFKKEQYHSSYVMDNFTATNVGSAEGRWIGLKFVIWNRSSDGKVEMELFIDKDSTNSWVKYLGKIDADDWGTGAAQCAGTPPGKKITWGSPVTMLKMDVPQATLFISYMSVREISPPS
jgi:calcineurin-like phosphoesterase family protein/SMP-30/gluconolaconase/LRE-like protein/NHL repeat-containing protein